MWERRRRKNTWSSLYNCLKEIPRPIRGAAASAAPPLLIKQTCLCFMVAPGGTRTRRAHTNSTQACCIGELDPQPSCCEATVLDTMPLCIYVLCWGKIEKRLKQNNGIMLCFLSPPRHQLSTTKEILIFGTSSCFQYSKNRCIYKIKCTIIPVSHSFPSGVERSFPTRACASRLSIGVSMETISVQMKNKSVYMKFLHYGIKEWVLHSTSIHLHIANSCRSTESRYLVSVTLQ